MNNKFKRFFAFLLAFIMFVPTTVFAEGNNYIYVPEIDIEDEVKNGNLFYLASSDIEINENSNEHYLVRIGRGGDLSEESSVVVKMSDITAKYGKDYKVFLYNGGMFNEADDDEDSLSVMEMIEGEDFNEFEINDTEELIKEIEDGSISESAISYGIAKGINEAVAINKASKGEDNSDYVEAAKNVEIVEAEEFDNSVVEDAGEAESLEEETRDVSKDLNTLAGAKQAFTGINSDRVKPKASTDIIKQFEQLKAYQDVADTISDAMTGATLEIEFEEGEKEKFIEIVPIDNNESDSTRLVNITIGDPQGQHTVSAHSSAVLKIADDEEQVRAKVSLAETSVTPDMSKNCALIKIKREGGLNDLVSVMLRSKSDTAMSGRDFSPVSAEVVFPFGVQERTVEIPVNMEYIKEEAKFEVFIDTPVSCEIGENDKTEVCLSPVEKSNEEKSNGESSDYTKTDSESDVELLMSETDYKNKQRVYFSEVKTNNNSTRYIEKSGSFKDNCEEEGDDGWYIRPTDSRKWARAEFGIDNKGISDYQYDVNGLTFSYRGKYAAHPHDGTAKVGFRFTTFDSNGVMGCLNDWQFTGGSSGWTEKTIYTKEGNIRGVQVYAEDDDGSGRDLQAHFKDMYPIKRQFIITLAPADKMYLRTVGENGIVLSEVQPSAYISNQMSKILGIDSGDTNTCAYRTSGEKITVTVGNNDYFKFKGLYAVNSNNPKDVIKIADANGNNSCTFTLDNELLKKLIHRGNQDVYDFVTLTDRKDGGMYGNFTIKPIFEYIDKKVYVEKNTQFENKLSIDAYNELGYLSVNGTPYVIGGDQYNVEVKPNDSLGNVFHYGDEFIVATNAKYTDIAGAAGVGYRTGINIDTMEKTRHDLRNNEAKYSFTRKNSKDILKKDTIAFYPVYTQKQNGLTLMVRKSDIDNGIIDASYGVMEKFNDSNVSKIIDYRDENGKKVEYYRFLVSTDVKTGTYYQYMARAKDGYAIKWLNDVTKTEYSGNTMFYQPLGLSQDENILVVTAETGDDVVFARFKGTTNYSVFDVSSGTNSSYQMPLVNAAITIGDVSSITDEKGEYALNDVRTYINGTHIIERVAVDNSFNYVDYVINTSNKKVAVPSEEQYTVESVKNESAVETTTVNVEKWKVVRDLSEVPENLRDRAEKRYAPKAYADSFVNSVYDEPKGNVEMSSSSIAIYNYPVTVQEIKTNVTEVSTVVAETKTGTVYTINMGNYNAKMTYDGAGIVDVNVYDGESTVALPGTIDINDHIHTFRADVRETSDEHIKALKFVIVDPVTKKQKYEMAAEYESSSKQWVATEKMDIAMNGTYTSGDTLYAVISTDKNVSGSPGALKEYLPVYTGYDFIQGDSAYDSYEPQNFDLPTNGSFGSLPMLDSLATGFDFPFVSIVLEKRQTGEYRVKIGVNVTDIVDVAAGTTLNTKKDDSGMGYLKNIDWLHHPINDLKARASFAYDSIFRKNLKETPLLGGTTSKLGPSQFRVSVVVGGYIDFGKMEVTQNGVTYSDFIVTGGGGYIGVSLTFRKAFYFIIAGVVPAYVGGGASGTLIGNMGATRKSNSVVALSSMKENQLELDDALAFNGNLNASMSVCLFAGVGLCDVLGVRLEGDVDVSLLWEPLAKQTYAMNDEVDEIIDNDYSNAKIHEVGFTVAFSLGGKVDLLLFTIPLMYHFKPIHTGFNKDIQNAHLRKTSSSTVDVDGTTKPTDSTAYISEGWYYIRNVHNNKYLQAKNGTTDLVYKTATENPAMRFYISVNKDKTITIKAQEGYSDKSAKYVMMDNNEPKLSNSITESDVTAYHKFILREPNVNDFNIISAAEGGEKYLMVGDNDKVIFDKTGADNDQLWRLEAVDEPIENGLYTIENKTLKKYLTDVDGKAQLADENKKDNQRWYVSVSDDYITVQNAETKNYLFVDSDSTGDGVGISVKKKDDSNAVYFDTTKLIDGSYNISTRYSLGKNCLTAYNSGSDVVSSPYNEKYNQAWTFTKAEITVKENAKTQAQMLSADGVSLFASNGGAEDVKAVDYTDDNDYSDDNVMLRKRTTGNSKWVANDNVNLLSGFMTVQENVLVENSYERPDSQVVNLGNGDYMLVFIDTDDSRGELERNVLKYAVYRNGQWLEPVVIQNDGTADFQPNVADAGENVAISWISSDSNSEKTGDPTQYLTTMEIYTTLVNKTTGEIGKITRLTNDTYYDYSPTVVYDNVTGDMAVYYIKSSIGNSFLETANSFTNDCIITYMLYDKDMGKWLTDYYYPEEVSDEAVAEELIKNWSGQRFLPSPIDELNMQDPLITDFTAISYNGLVVYGYTIDKDNDSSTNEDRDLFIQVYDFTTHKNYLPIRITDDDIADAMPQFVRAGGDSGNTFLYWFRGDNKLSYINVSDFAHNGLNDDGTVNSEYDLAPADVYINLPPEMRQGSNEAFATMSYYKVCVDKDDNIYVIWVDLDRETNKQEIFATAVITDKQSGTTSYADAYQLTHSGKHNDEPAFLIDESGNMVVVSTRYNSVRTEDPINPLEIKDTELVATIFEPFGEVYAENIELDNLNPKNGDTVNVTAKIYNRGLTVSKGYIISVSEVKDGNVVKNLGVVTSDEYINAGDYVDFNYQWNVGDAVAGKALRFTVSEGGMKNSSIAESDVLKSSADIKIDGVGIKQDNQDFILHFTATNNGNLKTSDSDKINLVYNPEKATAQQLGITNEKFLEKSIGGIEVGESKEYDVVIENLTGELFNAYGYLPVIAAVTDKDGNIISNAEESYIMMNAPIDINVNDTNNIKLNVGEAVDLQMLYQPFERFNDVLANYEVEDSTVAAIIANQIVGISKGVTKLIAKAQPYNSETEVDVIVGETDKSTDENEKHSGGGSSKRSSSSGNSEKTTEKVSEEAVEETSEDIASGETDDNQIIFNDIADYWAEKIIISAYKKGLIKGYPDNSYRPKNNVTRAEFATMLYNSVDKDEKVELSKLNFVDMTGKEWYADAVCWGVSKGIITGYDDNTFRGNNEISRQEMAVIVSKFIETTENDFEKGNSIVFDDENEISVWAKGYVDNISAYGIVRGDNNNCYMPRKSLNRGEAAVIINNVVK